MAIEFNKEKLYEVRDRLIGIYEISAIDCDNMNDEEMYQHLKELVDDKCRYYSTKYHTGTLAPEYEEDMEFFEDMSYILEEECMK